jgi:HSP20 family protein
MFRKKDKPEGALAPKAEHPLRRLRDEVEGLFVRFLGRSFAPLGTALVELRLWSVDLEDAGEELVVRAEVPGFEAEDFDLQLSGNLLTIRAEHKQQEEKKEDTHRFTARRNGHYQRSVMLPVEADPDKVTARYRNGVLEVHLPKTGHARQHRIDVQQ